MPAFLKSKIATVLLAIACLWLAVLAVSGTMRRINAQEELSRMDSDIQDEKNGNERISKELDRMKAPAWLALLARQHLNYKKPDESVAFVYKTQKSGTISQPQVLPDTRSNARKWWDWMRGK